MRNCDISLTVCTGATVNIFDDGKRAHEQAIQIDCYKNSIDWYERQLDHVREASLKTEDVAAKQRTALLTIREKLDDLGSNPEASTELHFLSSVNLLLIEAGFPKKQLPAVIKDAVPS